MRKKLCVALLIAVAAIFCVIGVSACGKKTPSGGSGSSSASGSYSASAEGSSVGSSGASSSASSERPSEKTVDYTVEVWVQDFLIDEYRKNEDLSASGSGKAGETVSADGVGVTLAGYVINAEKSAPIVLGDGENILSVYLDLAVDAHSDLFGGDDVIYTSHIGAFLEREALGERKKCDEYAATSGAFSITTDSGEKIGGRVSENGFYYYKDTYEKAFVSSDGERLTIGELGRAEYEFGNGIKTVGSYVIDERGDFLFVPDGSGEAAFAFRPEVGEELVFVKSGAERGYYALETSDGYDYDLVWLDGFGGLAAYSDPDAPDFDEYYAEVFGTYERGAADDVYSFAVNYYVYSVRLKPTDGELGGHKLSGTYEFGDGYIGTFMDIETEWEDLILDGFGSGTYKNNAGTYTVETLSWYVDDAFSISQYVTEFVRFTVTASGESYLFEITDVYYSLVNESAWGIFEIENASALPYEKYEKAFMYFYGYDVNGSEALTFATVWYGNTVSRYEGVEPVPDYDGAYYETRDRGDVFYSEELGCYVFLSDYGVYFSFTVDFENKKVQVYFLEENAVLFDDGNEKLTVSEFGVAEYTRGGIASKVDYSTTDAIYFTSVEAMLNSAFGYAKAFYFPELDRSFALVYEDAESTASVVKEISFIGDILCDYYAHLIIFADGGAVVGLDGDGGTLYFIHGAVTDGANGEKRFEATEDLSAYSDTLGEIANVFGEFGFKIAEIDGERVCAYYDAETDFTAVGAIGTLELDGYGTARFTPAVGETVECDYDFYGEVLWTVAKDRSADWYFIIGDNAGEKTLSFAGEESGIYYSAADGTSMLIFDGAGNVFGNVDYNYVEGTYEATGKTVRYANNLLLNEYLVSLTGESEFYAALYAAEDALHVGVYLSRDYGVGDFDVDDGYLIGDGYNLAVYTVGQSLYEGVMYIGAFDDGYHSDVYGQRDFVTDPEGSQILFISNDGEEFAFDIISENEAKLRDTVYGTYIKFDGDVAGAVLRLDGHGSGSLERAGESPISGNYEKVPAIDEYSYRFTSDGENFVFRVIHAYSEIEREYVFGFTVYTAEHDGVYTNGDWSLLKVDGFGGAIHVDKYGVVTDCTYKFISDTRAIFAHDGGELYVETHADGTFGYIEGEFLLGGADDEILYRYNGASGSVTIPAGVKRIAQGAFGGSVITHVDFNDVEIVESGVFEGQSLDGVYSEKIVEVGDRAFANSQGYSFETVYLPSAKIIGDRAFYGCSFLELVTLGAIERIGEYAFTGYNYSTLGVDLSAAADLTKIEIADTAFIALNYRGELSGEMSVRILVADVSAANQAYSAWSETVKKYVVIWRDESYYPSAEYYVDFASGAVYSLLNGFAEKNVKAADGSVITVLYGLYSKNADASEITVYPALGGGFDTEGLTLGGGATAVGSEVWFKAGSPYDGVEYTLSGDVSFTFSLTVSESSSETKFDKRFKLGFENAVYGETALDGSAVSYSHTDNTVRIVMSGTVIALSVTSDAAFTAEEIGRHVTVTLSERFRITFAVDADGNAFEVYSFARYDAEALVAGFSEIDISDCTAVSENNFTVEVASGYNYSDVYSVVYDPQSESMTVEFVSTIRTLITSGYSYRVTVVIDANGNITDCLAFAIGDGSYGFNPDSEILDKAPADDGTFALVTAEGAFVISVSVGDYGYEATVELVMSF